MSGWGGGYVTDITYMPGYYRQQSPAIMAVAGLLGGVACPLPGPDDPVSYMELGCGQGYGALLLAASNPSWRVTAIDFNPAHIAAARACARRADIRNITFMEADLSTLAEAPAARDIPLADFVSLHGVWTWVPRPVQTGIIRLLRDKVVAGGIVHVSYNALPGWAGVVGLQRLLRDAGRRLAGRSDRQAEEGRKFATLLNQADAVQLRRQPMVQSLLERLDTLPIQYVAHEYMNDSWAPCFHADVAGAFAEAKLEFVASAQLIENFLDLTLTDTQRPLYQRFDDPLLRELVKDMCLERSLRHDVFVRGARRIDAKTRDAALMDLFVVLTVPPEDLPLEVQMPAGQAELAPGFYGPIAKALVAGPRRVGDLLALPELGGRRDNPAELTGILLGLGQAELALRPAAGPGEAALRFNRAAAEQLVRTEQVAQGVAMASLTLGGGMPATVFDLFVTDRLRRGESEAQFDAWVDAIGGAMNTEGRDKLRDLLARSLQVRIPVLRAAGVL
jgi:SAM-dependent methyltransferase